MIDVKIVKLDEQVIGYLQHVPRLGFVRINKAFVTRGFEFLAGRVDGVV